MLGFVVKSGDQVLEAALAAGQVEKNPRDPSGSMAWRLSARSRVM